MKKVLLVLVVLLVLPLTALAQYCPPDAVDLIYFRLVPRGCCAVVAEWETAQELDNLGFNVYASQGEHGEKVKLNPELIPARYLGTPLGAEYFFIDGLRRGTHYWLEDINNKYVSTFHGPEMVSWRTRLSRPRPVPAPAFASRRLDR